MTRFTFAAMTIEDLLYDFVQTPAKPSHIGRDCSVALFTFEGLHHPRGPPGTDLDLPMLSPCSKAYPRCSHQQDSHAKDRYFLNVLPFFRFPPLLFPLPLGFPFSSRSGRLHCTGQVVGISVADARSTASSAGPRGRLHRSCLKRWLWRSAAAILALKPGVTESGNTSRCRRNAPSAIFENRCLNGAEPLPDDVHRGHYLTTHQGVQSFCQRSQFPFGGRWKSRPCLRQQRTVEVAHRWALFIGGCFELSGGLGVPDLAGERDDGGFCDTHSQFCTAFFACTLSVRGRRRRVSASTSKAAVQSERLSVTSRHSHRLALGSTIFASAQSNYPFRAISRAAPARRASSPRCFCCWKSTVTQRASIRGTPHGLGTIPAVEKDDELPRGPHLARGCLPRSNRSPSSAASSPTCPLSSTSGARVPNVGPWSKWRFHSSQWSCWQSRRRCWQLVSSLGHGELKCRPKSTCTKRDNTTVEPSPNHWHVAWNFDVSRKHSRSSEARKLEYVPTNPCPFTEVHTK